MGDGIDNIETQVKYPTPASAHEDGPELPPHLRIGTPIDPPPWPTFPPTLAWSKALAWGELRNPAAVHQANIPGKDGKPGYTYKYADLADVLDIARPILAKYGLALSATVTNAGNESVTVVSKLDHWTGESEEGPPLTMYGGRSAQALGSAITYARRYSQTAMLGIAPEEDDGGRATTEARQERPEAQRRTNTASGPPKRSQADPGPSGGDVGAHAPAPIARPPSPPETPIAALAQHYRLPSAKPWVDAVNILRESGEPLPKQPAEVDLLIIEQLNAHYAELTESEPMDMAPWVQAEAGADEAESYETAGAEA